MNLLSNVAWTKDFIRLKVLIMLIYIILELYYYNIVSLQWNHLGYNLNFDIIKYIITKIVFIGLLCISLLLFDRSKFLYSIYLLLIFFFYIPNAILFSFGDFSYAPFLCNVFFVSFFVTSFYFKFKIPSFSFSENTKIIGLIGLSILIVIPIVYRFKSDIHLNTLFLKDIYETRAIFSEKLTGIVSYLYHISVKTILPIGLVFFMIRKKPVFIVLYFLILIYLFVISGNKLVYFTSTILLSFYYLGKDYVSKINYFFIITIVLFISFPFIDAYVIKARNSILVGTFVNRFLFTPAILTQWYFEFFDGKPFYFAESHVFNMFIKSPYDMPVGFLISKVYLNEPTVYANNGVVSDGFMNLGYGGVVLFSVVFAALFGLFNSLKLHVGYFGLFFSYIYVFLSAPFLSCFITGGVFLFIILAIFILRDKQH